MKLAVFFGVHEGDKSYAHRTLEQLLDILKRHEVYVLILDDASPSNVGHLLAQRFSRGGGVTLEVIRLEKSSGYRGAMERTLFAYRHMAQLKQSFDYILRVDPDVFFNRSDLSSLFDQHLLPKQGLVGASMDFRLRDFVQIFADLLPLGFRRRKRNGIVEHKWELRRMRSVWWWDLGLRAFLHGFDRRFIVGPLQIFAGTTLSELAQRGWLDRRPLDNPGLVFGEDVMTNILIKALGQPLIDFGDLLSDWNCDMAINPQDTAYRQQPPHQAYLIHPLKGDSWGLWLRKELEQIQRKRRSMLL